MLLHRRRWIRLIAAATVAIALFVILLPRAEHRERASPPANHVDATEAEAVTAAEARPKLDAHRDPAIAQGAASPTASTPATEPALPPDGTPLTEFALELDRRARAGDARAAFRLGAELRRCRSVGIPGVGSNADQMLADNLARQSLSAEERERRIQAHLAYDAARKRIQQICAGLDRSQFLNENRYFLISAQQGNSASALHFLTTPGAADLIADPELAAEWYERFFAHSDLIERARQEASRAPRGGEMRGLDLEQLGCDTP